MTSKRLYRSQKERMIWGVAGGLAEYFGIDPVIVRIAFVILFLAGGFTIILYPILAVIMPKASNGSSGGSGDYRDEFGRQSRKTSYQDSSDGPPGAGGYGSSSVGVQSKVLPIALGALGLIALCVQIFGFWWISWGTVWPLALIALGVGLMVTRSKRA